ncbi:MAG: bifunctional phosphopantothenoylcysteine decarboxylase/phosphopantothenate--cysteine ligase CoaBC [Deltaproteobacteria bacterium]|nr:bifunctional phosphopantothenoylcysteine decarboxylase/phosphopantothenate--cysteine ligase CoaBC [Deltaproteobacteria bacterium]
MSIKDKTIILGITGGIAAYKAAELTRLLIKAGAKVHIIMTRGAAEFVTPLTFQTLSKNPVHTDLFSLCQEADVGHISLADRADLFVIAPATANIIGKIANGIANDLLTTSVMATKAPVLLAPAMNCNMYENPIVQENMEKLKKYGYCFIDSETGELACGYEGKGRMAEPSDILEEMETILSPKDLKGERILVTAGPTCEAIDPVRFIGNRSSGKMGYALAKMALRRGAGVTLISGPSSLKPPRGVKFISVESAEEMRKAVITNLRDATTVVMAAAVADYTPVKVAFSKIKKSKEPLSLELAKTLDILSEIGQKKSKRLLIGFAAETENLVANAKKKLKEKNLDLIVANNLKEPGAGFGVDTNIVTIMDKNGSVEELPKMSKEDVAWIVLDRMAGLCSRI